MSHDIGQFELFKEEEEKKSYRKYKQLHQVKTKKNILQFHRFCFFFLQIDGIFI